MNIKHEIISFHPLTGSMTVRYFCDQFPDGLIYNIDIPLENGAFIAQDKINELIEVTKPVGQLERLVTLKSAVIPGEFQAIIEPEQIVDLSARLRNQRNVELTRCDWTQLADAPLSDIQKAAWRDYRQALRDVTSQAGFPDNVLWPASPDLEPR